MGKKYQRSINRKEVTLSLANEWVAVTASKKRVAGYAFQIEKNLGKVGALTQIWLPNIELCKAARFLQLADVKWDRY